MANRCKECGCICKQCIQNVGRHSDMHLHAEIENLRQRLMEKDCHIVTMETQFLNEADKFPNGELASLKDEMLICQDKYTRLYEAHKRVQKVNQNLEDKLLRIVDKCETEKGALTKDIATLSHRLADANYTIHLLSQDNEKYRNDVNLAIQLLQCKPSNFIGQKYESLPAEVQAKVRTYVAQKGPCSDPKLRDVKSITVPIATFPPTAMVYNVTRASASKNEEPISNDPKPPVNIVSASIMAKILGDREKERIFAKHCQTCSCHRSMLKVDSEVQTIITSETSCNDCQNKQEISRADDVENRDNVNERRNNFKYDRTTKQYEQIRDSCSRSIFWEVNDCLKTGNKLRTQNSDSSSKHTIHQCMNEVAESKNNQRSDLLQTVSRTFGSRSYSSLRNSTKHQNSINSQKMTVETKLLALENLEDKQDEKFDFLKKPNKSNHCSDVEKASSKGRAAQVDIINERLWKSSWIKSESQPLRDPYENHRIQSSKDTRLDVINDRVWKNCKSKTKEAKPTQLTLIEVASIDELTNTSEIIPAETTASPSFSNDSVIFSTSDPSSISSDVIKSSSGGLLKQKKRDCNTTSKSSEQARISGLTNCLMRVSGRSNNILLDNVHNYQLPSYANTVATINTTALHTTNSCKSTKSASTSSEENPLMKSPDNVQLRRVAEWVKSSVQLDESCVQFQSKPLLKVKTTEAEHFGEDSKNHSPEIQLKSFVDELKYSQNEENNAEEKEEDLITFDPSSDEEEDLNVIELDSAKVDPNLDINYAVKITKEMEETYLKLTASLDPVALRLSSLTGTDLTIRKYRQDHRRFQKVSAKSGSAT